MLEQKTKLALDDLIAQIKESATYKEYHLQLERLKAEPDFYRQVNEFRQKNYELQNAPKSEDLLERVEAFGVEYEAFRQNPLVDDFLQAELAFCRMIQNINLKIMEEMEFE
ncbi:MAG: YlbF family regulator [Lachnospiraceae bacterium]|nr:YlbF family regulator [Lachnospiraceae bacterium]